MANKRTNDNAAIEAKPVEAALAAGQETVEAVVKASTEAATAGYEQAAAMAKEQAEKTSKAVFKGYGDFSAFGQEYLDAMVKSGGIFAEGFETLGKEWAAFARASFEDNVATTKAVLGAKSLHEMVELQTRYTRKNIDQTLAETSKLAEFSVKVANEALAPIQARVNLAVEKMIKPTVV